MDALICEFELLVLVLLVVGGFRFVWWLHFGAGRYWFVVCWDCRIGCWLRGLFGWRAAVLRFGRVVVISWFYALIWGLLNMMFGLWCCQC